MNNDVCRALFECVSIQIFWLILSSMMIIIVDDHLHDHCPHLLVKRMVTTICCYASCIVE
ncbi:hypothetical protein DERP_003877 [Dermatophagoides pteronyssinus]|uniref:Uncharacterized protein n=1 Tax=Dermatophagoides pteronyssinus TaxID=6956 RepID=A0ABQ8J7H5_DERPT|nr:hypothetical protein DERP_003877 [Dermatophagoides pteronyssinus]